MERVTVETGNDKNQVLIVCPHAPDHKNLDIITKSIQKNLKCYSVLNNGYKKCDYVDSLNDLGDCNRIDHLLNNKSMKSEFLIPIINSTNKMLINNHTCYIFYIHGFSGKVNQIDEGEIELDIIIGGGIGKRQSSLTCHDWKRAIFHDYLFKDTLQYGSCFRIATAINGKFGAKRNINMCQYFRNYSPNNGVQSLQLEISNNLRKTSDLAERTGEWIASSIQNTLNRIEDCYLANTFDQSVIDTEEFLFDYQ